MTSITKRPVTFVLVAGTAFSLASPLARYARPMHPMVIAFGRVALAAVILAAFDPSGIVRSAKALSARHRLAVFGAGVLLAAHFALFLWGLDATSLPAAVSLVSLEPFSVVLCGWAIHGLRPKRLELLGVIAATVGAVIVARGVGAGDHRLLGDVLVLLAVILFGFYVSVARVVRDALPAPHYAPLVYGVAALVLALAMPLSVRSGAWGLEPHSLVALVLLAIIPTVIGHTLVQTAARHLSPSTIALVPPGETLGGILIGAIALRAIPTRYELIGALVILVGSAIAIAGTRTRTTSG